jgi:hypothetical protein
MMAVMATSAAAGWYPDPNGQPGLRYFDGTHWTEHRRVLTANTPPPEDDESRYSDAVERVLQVFIDTYNNAYAESVATGRMFTTSEMAKGFTGAAQTNRHAPDTFRPSCRAVPASSHVGHLGYHQGDDVAEVIGQVNVRLGC